MTDSFNMPVPPWKPEQSRPGAPLKPDSVEWWNDAPARQSGTPPPAPVSGQRVIGRPNYGLHLALFVLAALSTTFIRGLSYGVTVMAILLAHEMGHYLMARHYRVPATLPYFIPMPFSIFGTMGAVIRMASLGQDRKVLFDIGVAGPIAGLVLAVPACLIGLQMSDVVEVAKIDTVHISLGSSLLFQWFSDLVKGPLPPGYDIQLHPIAFAGWAGLFVTALNLLPVGQLDGGHAAYALLGRSARWLSFAVAFGFLGLAIFISPEWLFMAALLLLFGIRHPPTGDDSVPMDMNRKLIGALLMILFVVMFTPRPFNT